MMECAEVGNEEPSRTVEACGNKNDLMEGKKSVVSPSSSKECLRRVCVVQDDVAGDICQFSL